jgi:hypothetical protein
VRRGRFGEPALQRLAACGDALAELHQIEPAFAKLGEQLRLFLFDMMIDALGQDLEGGVEALIAGFHSRLAHRNRPVIAMVGDGAMQMNNMAELITLAKYRKPDDAAWICVVFNNQDLNQVTWEQRVMEGDPKFEASQQIPEVAYHKFAELIGLKGIYVDDPARLGAAFDEAFASDAAARRSRTGERDCRYSEAGPGQCASRFEKLRVTLHAGRSRFVRTAASCVKRRK